MILSASQLESSSDDDIIIVGAGAVGLVMAVELARNGRSVTLLEAGLDCVSASAQRPFELARSIGHPLPGLHLGRFRALGGTTNFWGGQCVRFDPSVFERRDWISDDCEWPLRRAELDPFYDRALQLLGMEKVIRQDKDVEAQLGIAAPPLPKQLTLFFSRWTPEPNFARLFDDAIRNSPNLKVVLDATVTSLVAGAERNRIAAVTINGSKRLNGRMIVLANGTIEIARLLLLPLADQRRPIWADSEHLGKGFMDHIDCAIGQVIPLDKRKFHQVFDNAVVGGIKYQPKLKLSDDFASNERLVGVAGHFVFNSSLQEHLQNAKIMMKALRNGRLSDFRINLDQLQTAFTLGLPMALRYLRHRRIFTHADLGIQLRVNVEQKPVEASCISLSQQRDDLGVPTVKVDWKIDGSEISSILRFSKIVQSYLRTSGLADVIFDPMLESNDAAFVSKFEDMNHHMGTVRMAETCELGVVDRTQKVYGTDNLFVAGAAVFPSTGFANPTFTAIALGLRLARALTHE